MTETLASKNAASASRTLILAALLFVGVLAGGAVWLWNGPGSSVVAAPDPFSLKRQADGTWPAIPTESSAFALSIEAAKRKSKVHHSTSSWVSSAASARFASNSFAIIAMSDNALTDLIALRMITELQADTETQSISYRPKSQAGEIGTLAPDIVITIDTRKLRDDTTAGNGGMRAECVVTAGDQLAHSNHHAIDDKQAPHVVNFGSRTTATVAIEQSGIATPNARLVAIAHDLASTIAKSLRDELGELRSNKGEFPGLPAAFTSEYRAVNAAAFRVADIYGEGNQPTQLASWHGRLLHNQTWWLGSVPRTRADASLAITESMIDSGWQPTKPNTETELTFSKGALQVTVLYAHPSGGINSTIAGEPETPPGERPCTEVFVRYQERASDEARHHAAESLFSDDVSAAALMVCSPMWNESQHERGRALINTRELSNPADLMQRSYLRERAGDNEGMIADLRRAHWLAKAGFETRDAVKKATTKAKKLGVDIKTADADWLRNNGFRALQPGDAIEAEVTRDAPIRLVFARDELPAIVAIGLLRNGEGQWRVALQKIEGGLTSTTANITHGSTSTRLKGGTLRVELLDEPDDAVARLRVELLK